MEGISLDQPIVRSAFEIENSDTDKRTGTPLSEHKCILTFCAHPDDAEFLCGGTLILLSELGWEVHIATLSAGDCGSVTESPEEIMARRRREAEDASAIVHGTYHCLERRDLQVYDDNATRGDATALIRRVRPDCVITHYPVDYMSDHIAASAVARTAVFTAPIKNYTVGSAQTVQPTSAVVPVYYLMPLEGTDHFGNPVAPEFAVDISRVIERKAEMLACHKSQRDWLRKQHGVDEYIERMKQWDAELGRAVGCAFAEGFSMHRGHGYPQTALIQDALAPLLRAYPE